MQSNFKFKVEDVINDGNVTKNEIKKIKIWLKYQPFDLPDELLCHFIYACERNLEQTKVTIGKYVKMKKKFYKIFTEKCSDGDVKKAENIIGYNIAFDDEKKKIIYLAKLVDSDQRKYSCVNCIRLSLMVFDLICFNYKPGNLLYIYSMENFTLMHMFKSEFELLRNFIYYLQECIPLKLEGIHVLKASYISEKMYSLMKPFLSSKTLSLVHFYKNANTSGEMLTKEYIPEEYGGTLPPFEVGRAKVIDEIKNIKAILKNEEEYLERLKI